MSQRERDLVHLTDDEWAAKYEPSGVVVLFVIVALLVLLAVSLWLLA